MEQIFKNCFRKRKLFKIKIFEIFLKIKKQSLIEKSKSIKILYLLYIKLKIFQQTLV